MRLFLSWRKGLIGAGLLALLLGAGAWAKRDQVLTWYYVRGLSRAAESDRRPWIDRVVGLDEAAIPALLGCLRQEDPSVCSNARAAFSCLIERWGPEDTRRSSLADQLAAEFPSLSVPGQQSVLELQTAWVQAIPGSTPPPPSLLRGSARLLGAAAQVSDQGVHARALPLAGLLAGRTTQPEVLAACRELARACLHDKDQENRSRGIALAVRPRIDLLKEVVELLEDPAAEVRRAAMLATGPLPEVIATDDLVPWLHDRDPVVRDLCEKALRSRGLSEGHLKLARLKSDPDPKVRLHLVETLPDAGDLDLGVWLRSMSHDTSPAVRAAAVRLAAEQTQFDLTDRIEQMAHNDPCPTIRQVARYYLVYRKSQGSMLAQ